MEKIKNYFSHDSNARNSDKLINVRMELGAEGYGVYFMILERLREEDDYKSKRDYKMIAFDLRVEDDVVKRIVEEFDLFELDNEYFYSQSFLRRMQVKDEKKKKRQSAGKAGANKRWEQENNENKNGNAIKNNSNAIAMPLESDSNAIAKNSKEKERKGKERKEKKKISNTSDCVTDEVEEFEKLSTRKNIDLVVAEWNKIENMRNVVKVSQGTKRYNLLKARISEYGIEKVLECVHGVERSSFLKGYSDSGWQADFDWFIKPSNFIKVLEGKYEDKREANNASNGLGGKDKTPSGDKAKGKYDDLYDA